MIKHSNSGCWFSESQIILNIAQTSRSRVIAVLGKFSWFLPPFIFHIQIKSIKSKCLKYINYIHWYSFNLLIITDLSEDKDKPNRFLGQLRASYSARWGKTKIPPQSNFQIRLIRIDWQNGSMASKSWKMLQIWVSPDFQFYWLVQCTSVPAWTSICLSKYEVSSTRTIRKPTASMSTQSKNKSILVRFSLARYFYDYMCSTNLV
jgi:hypothetical protein